MLLIIFLFTQVYEIDTIFVTASRATSHLAKASVSARIIPEEIILYRTLGDASSLFANEAGIDLRRYSFLKGISSLSIFGSSSQQVLVLIDGLPFYSPSTGLPDLGLIPVFALKRVEIGKGPHSHLYGANALGGVVNFISKSPLEEKTKRLNFNTGLLYGSSHTISLFQNYNLNLRDRLGFTFGCHREESEGERSNSDCKSIGFSLATSYLENFSCNLSYEAKEIGVPGPKPPVDFLPPYGDTTSTSLYDRQKDNLYRMSAKISHWLNDFLKISFSPYTNWQKTSYLWVDQFSVDTAIYSDTHQIKTFGGNLVLNLSSEEKGFATGLDFRFDDFLSHSHFYDEEIWQYRDTTYNPRGKNLGLFLESYFGKNFSFSPSFRYDYSSLFGGFLSPSFGMNYFLPLGGKLRFSLAQGYRAPTFNDLYWPRAGNLELRPERGFTGQLGFDTSFASFTFFFRKSKDLIAWLPDTAGLWRPTNVDQQEVFGFEWQANFEPLSGLALSFGGDLKRGSQIKKEMVYLDSFQFVSRRAPFLPKFKFLPAIIYRSPFKTNIHLEGNFISDRVNYYPSYDSFPKVYVREKKLPSYFILSFRLEQELFENLFFTLKVENLFDTPYLEQFGNTFSDRDYPHPGRLVLFGVRVKN